MSADRLARCVSAMEALARIDGFRVKRLELVPLPEPVEERPRPVLRQTPAEFAAGRGKRGNWK